MTDRYVARGLISAKSSRIEKLLRDLGAQGNGLKELRSSITEKLSRSIQSQIRSLHSVRNQASHEDNFEISEPDLRKFAAAADDVIFQLELMVSDEAGMAADARELSNSSEDASNALENVESLQPHLSEGDREILRKRELAEAENRRLAKEMDSKFLLRGTSGLSPETKAKIKKAAITAGIYMIGSMFKR